MRLTCKTVRISLSKGSDKAENLILYNILTTLFEVNI